MDHEFLEARSYIDLEIGERIELKRIIDRYHFKSSNGGTTITADMYCDQCTLIARTRGLRAREDSNETVVFA